MEVNKIYNGDCLEVLKTLPENSIDSIVTDPPYELGFMGKSWDSTGIANNPSMWAECLRVLKPGGHLLAFSGTRTYHRMASAIEDAGFEVRDMIEWVYGSGFPKSLNIGKAVDKLRGNERVEYIHKYASRRVSGISSNASHEYGFDTTKKTDTKGTSEWEGWGTALKPAHEPICMARKPISEKTIAENVLKYGTGGINIDESRVYTEYYLQGNDLSDIISICQLNHLQLSANNAELKRFQDDMTSVIKNLFSVAENVDMPILEKILGKVQEDISKKDTQCSEEMLMESININLNTFISGKNTTEQSQKDLKYIISTVLKMITDWKIYNVSAYQLTEVLLTKAKNEVNTREKSGRFPANLLHDNSEEVRECFPENVKGEIGRAGRKSGGNYEASSYKVGVVTETGFKDNGNASRFFKSIIYQAKASKSERNKGCEGLEEKKPAVFDFRPTLETHRENWTTPIDETPYGRGGVMKNNHPTVKPIALMEYLIKMVTPKGGIVLDPFAGSGSTLVAAKQNGFQYIGIEMTEEYIPIMEARLQAVRVENTLF